KQGRSNCRYLLGKSRNVIHKPVKNQKIQVDSPNKIITGTKQKANQNRDSGNMNEDTMTKAETNQV
ncbi:MAG: hypothetical protein ACRC7N_09695, partial [Clostridium sp.]